MKLVAIFCAASFAAIAQVGTSTITGRVTDATGAVAPNVNVSVVQKTTNFVSSAVTNTEGLYRVSSLQPGFYRVTFESAGFKKAVRDDIDLRTGDTLAVDMSMQVGQVTESIEVTGATQLLQTETSAAGTVMTGNVLYEMPLYQRYINATLNLVPGMSSGGFAYGGDLGSYHLSGQRNGSIGLFEDGVIGNDTGVSTVKPLQNAVAEVNVITTVAPAEYGGGGGGVISVVKKSGTNELHGMGSWFGRTRRMQHRRYFDGRRTSEPSPGRPNGLPVFFMMPDANVGGPIYIPKVYDGRNKTFFFFGYQRLHEKKVAQLFETVPTLDMRQGIFSFPGVTTNPLYDPATTRNVNGTWMRDPFPGNRIPFDRIDPVARKVLEYDPWVLPNQPGAFTTTGPSNNLLADEFAKVFFNDWNVRLDHQFSPAFKLYGSFTKNDQSGWGRPKGIRFDRAEFDSANGNYSPLRQMNSSAGYTWVATNAIVNDSRVGFLRSFRQTEVPSLGADWPSKLGIPNTDNALMPNFGLPNNYGLQGATPSTRINETLSFRNDTTWVRGSHALKFGYGWIHVRLNQATPARPSSFAFDGVTAGLQPNGSLLPNTGITFAGFLTGYVRQATFTGDLTTWLPRSSVHSFYLQDDWKVTPRLTLNLGIRYTNESPFHTKYGLMSNFDPSARDELTGGPGAITHPTGGLSTRDNNNFGPRLGLSWHPLEKIVFRGGIGLYTVDIKFPQERGQFDEYTYTANQQPLPGDPTPIFRISRGPDPVNITVRQNGSTPFSGTNYGSRSVEWWDQKLRNPYVLNFNASVQYEFIKSYLLDISYQGSSGVGLLERWQYNTFPIDYFAGNPTQQQAVFAAAQNYRPFPQFGDIRFRSNFGHSTFHSGTVKLEKRMSKGLYFQTFYTYSKAIDSQDGDNDGAGVAPIQNRGLEKGRAGFDRTHRVIGVVNYELPFGQGKKWASSGLMKTVLGGFELSWIQTQESGNPITFGYTGSPFNYYPGFAGNGRPDIVSPLQVRDGWYDLGGDRFTNANIRSVYTGDNNGLANFQLPGGCGQLTSIPAGFDRTRCDFRIGNAGRNIITGLPLRWTQVSAQKNFQIKERYKVQLRWDMQNVFKRYNFNTPTATVDFRNPTQFGKVSSDPTTASLGGQPLMNLTVMVQF